MAIINKLQAFFCDHPTARLRVRQIEREAKIPLPSAIRYAKELEGGGFLTHATIGGVKFYAADRSSRTFLLEKRLHNLRLVHTCGLVDHLIQECDNPAIILFGSYARGEDTEESDVDLYLETPSAVQLDLSRFETALQRKIHLFRYPSIFKVENKELANNMINGVVLSGYVEVFR